jgi:hypothetical protein
MKQLIPFFSTQPPPVRNRALSDPYSGLCVRASGGRCTLHPVAARRRPLSGGAALCTSIGHRAGCGRLLLVPDAHALVLARRDPAALLEGTSAASIGRTAQAAEAHGQCCGRCGRPEPIAAAEASSARVFAAGGVGAVRVPVCAGRSALPRRIVRDKGAGLLQILQTRATRSTSTLTKTNSNS